MEFGPLWIDQPNWVSDPRYVAAESVQKQYLEDFVEKGYVIFKHAVPEDIVDQILADAHGIYDRPENYVLKGQGKYLDPAELTKLNRGNRIIDLYAVSAAARDAIMTSPVADFLNLIFDEPPIAMQSLFFEYGSQQAIHQDTAYVVSGKPLSLAASWIALEDVTAGSGELIYYPGSHRFQHFLFSDAHKSWVQDRDGQEQHKTFLKSLHQQASDLGIKKDSFIAQKGDVLIWHADLAHGGSKIKNDMTRRSLVAHYCPLSVKPKYKDIIKDTYFELPHPNNGHFSCRHYDIRHVSQSKPGALVFNGGIRQRPTPSPAPESRRSSLLARVLNRLKA